MKDRHFVHEVFNDEEFEQLKQAKGKQNWHDFIMKLRDPTMSLRDPTMSYGCFCVRCGSRVNDINPYPCPKCGYPEEVKT